MSLALTLETSDGQRGDGGRAEGRIGRHGPGGGADPTEVVGVVRLFPPPGRGWDGVVVVVERVNGARAV